MDPLIVTFSLEECVYLANAAKISMSTLPGIDAQRFAALEPQLRTLALATVDRSLRARGTVTWLGEAEREVHAVISGLLKQLAHPVSMLTMSARQGQQTMTTSATVTTGFFITYVQIQPDVYRFTVVNNRQDAQTVIGETLAMSALRHPVPSRTRTIQSTALLAEPAAKQIDMLLHESMLPGEAEETSVRLCSWQAVGTPQNTLFGIIENNAETVLVSSQNTYLEGTDIVANLMLAVQPCLAALTATT